MLAKEAEAKQQAQGPRGGEGGRGKSKETLPANLREGFREGESSHKAAAAVNVSPRTIDAASKVLASGSPTTRPRP